MTNSRSFLYGFVAVSILTWVSVAHGSDKAPLDHKTALPIEAIHRWEKTVKIKPFSFTLVVLRAHKDTEALMFVYDQNQQAQVLRNPPERLLQQLEEYFLGRKNAAGKIPKSLILGCRSNGECKNILNYSSADFRGKNSLHSLFEVELSEIANDLRPPD